MCANLPIDKGPENRAFVIILLGRVEAADKVIPTSKSSYKRIIGKSITNNRYVYGYYYENNHYYIYEI